LKCPGKVRVGFADYDIGFGVSMDALGMCDIMKQEITVNNEMASQQQAQTLLHEIFHAISHQVHCTKQDEQEEEFVRRFSSMMAICMRDSPEVFKWIVSVLK